MLYVKVIKVIYGLLKSALLFYTKVVKDMEDYGLNTNPYGPFVANAVING